MITHVVFFRTSKYYITSQTIEHFYMIARTLTELYLRHFNQLHGALCLCWQSAICNATKQLDINKLKVQIRSYGIYNHENAIKVEEHFIIKEKLLFKTLTWANDFTEEENNDNIFCEYIELYERALKEVENNLLEMNDKAKQIAYANFILHDFNRSFHHIQTMSDSEQNNRCKEFFEFVLNRQFISENEILSAENENNTPFPNYNLSVRLINHLDFIDKLIEIFSYLEIDLLALSIKYKHNLYLFDKNKNDKPVDYVFGLSIETAFIEERSRNNFQNNILPKFNTPLSDDCLVKIMQCLFHKKMLDNPNSDVWLFWFNRKYIKVPEPLSWKGTPSMLSNIIQHLCGESISSTIKTAFCMKEYVKPTKHKYERSRMHKEIEQIITISKQKNN